VHRSEDLKENLVEMQKVVDALKAVYMEKIRVKQS